MGEDVPPIVSEQVTVEAQVSEWHKRLSSTYGPSYKSFFLLQPMGFSKRDFKLSLSVYAADRQPGLQLSALQSDHLQGDKCFGSLRHIGRGV